MGRHATILVMADAVSERCDPLSERQRARPHPEPVGAREDCSRQGCEQQILAKGMAAQPTIDCHSPPPTPQRLRPEPTRYYRPKDPTLVGSAATSVSNVSHLNGGGNRGQWNRV